jgi:acyl-CoA synthetase (AMP-forming)/AMP-acid ligase II
MPALFSPQSNRYLRLAIVVLVAAPIVLITALLVWVRTPWITGEQWFVEQPIEFDHRHHVKDDGIDCLYCHSAAERSQHAGIPSNSLCMGCHNQIWNDTPQLELLRENYFARRPTVWGAVYDLPDFVYFNHAAHLDHGIGCSTCHGQVDEMPRVYQATPMTMGWCLDCHRNPGPHLRPRNQITTMPWQPLPPEAQAELAAEYGVQSKTHCTTCHR